MRAQAVHLQTIDRDNIMHLILQLGPDWACLSIAAELRAATSFESTFLYAYLGESGSATQ
jgi:hypothetical protein